MQVKEDDVKEIVAEHLVKGRVVQRLCYDPEQAKKLVAEANIPFYQKQYRIVLRNRAKRLNPNRQGRRLD